MVDQSASNAVVSVSRMHRDLLYVTSAVNGRDQQIGDRAVVAVREHPRPAVTLKQAKDLYR